MKQQTITMVDKYRANQDQLESKDGTRRRNTSYSSRYDEENAYTGIQNEVSHSDSMFDDVQELEEN